MAAVIMRRAAFAPWWVAVLMAAACDDDPLEPGFGDLRVSIVTTGEDRDLDGYVTLVDGGIRGEAVASDTAGGVATRATLFRNLPAGQREVEVHDVASNCAVSGDNPRAVTVTAGRGVEVAFVVTCFATGVRVTTITTGPDLDADGYSVGVDGAIPRSIAVNGAVAITRLSAGTHTVALTDLAANCTVSGSNPRAVTVVSRQVVSVDFSVTCRAITGSVKVTTATTGADLDLDGYSVRLDSDTSRFVGVNGTHTFVRVLDGSHSVRLDGLASNCTVSGENPRTVSVVAGATAEVAFAITCAALGAVKVTTTTTGTDLDLDGYFVHLDSGSREFIGGNGTFTFVRVLDGSHKVALEGLVPNCVADGDNPRTVNVVAGATVEVTFAVSCAALGNLQVTAATTGIDLDPNGYGVSATGAKQSGTASLPANGTASMNRLVAGDYTVTLSGVTMNCDVAGANPRSVTVPSGGTATITFDVGCARAPEIAVALNGDIYLVKSNGAGLTRLTTVAGDDGEPAWSPDGSKIAFTSYRDGNQEIYVMNADGSSQTRLTSNLAGDGSPTWSPDGDKIAFVSARDGNYYELYVMNADGTNVERRTNNSAHEFDPAWSPDGSKIAFSSGRDGNNEIYVMNADGSDPTRLTSNAAGDHRPAWSANGAKLAFSRLTACDYYSSFCYADLFVMNADGSGAAPLTSGLSDWDAAWSPDDRWIAFTASFCQSDYYYGGCYFSHNAVQLVRADGTRRTEVLAYASHPAWKP